MSSPVASRLVDCNRIMIPGPRQSKKEALTDGIRSCDTERQFKQLASSKKGLPTSAKKKVVKDATRGLLLELSERPGTEGERKFWTECLSTLTADWAVIARKGCIFCLST
jgi:hypothetical protein